MDLTLKILRFVLIVVIYTAICYLIAYIVMRLEQRSTGGTYRNTYRTYDYSYRTYTRPRPNPVFNETPRERKIRLLRAKAAATTFPHEAAAFNEAADRLSRNA